MDKVYNMNRKKFSFQIDFPQESLRPQTNLSKLYISPYINPKIIHKKKKHSSCEIVKDQLLKTPPKPIFLLNINDDLVTPRCKIYPTLPASIQIKRK